MGKVNISLYCFCTLSCSFPNLIQTVAFSFFTLMFYSFIFHKISFCLFTRKNIFPLNIAVHHDNCSLIIRIITDEHRHCSKSDKLTGVSPAMSGNNLIAAIFHWSGNAWHQYSMLPDAFHRFLHLFIIQYLKRVSFELMQFWQCDFLYLLCSCLWLLRSK